MRVLFAGTPGVRKAVALKNLSIAIERLFPRGETVFRASEAGNAASSLSLSAAFTARMVSAHF